MRRFQIVTSSGRKENMPIFVEWEWKENTKTFLVIFHLWEDKKASNLRTRTEKYGFETVMAIPEDYANKKGEFVEVYTVPFDIDEREYLSWAPSHINLVFSLKCLRMQT